MARVTDARRPAATWRNLLIGLCLLVFHPALARGQGTAPPPNTISAPADDFCAPQGGGRTRRANRSTYRTLLAQLMPGDTLFLAPGRYQRLTIAEKSGMPGRCITIAGPATGPAAVITGEIGHRTVEIVGSSYIVLRNLTIDSLGIPGANGVTAAGAAHRATHHIVLDGNLIIGAGANQQTDGISTKAPTWNWVIRRNRIIAAGTAIYLGDSDGSSPFIAGIIEDNLVLDPVGYCMEVKYQRARPPLAGMPQGSQSTIVRNNVFIKDDRPSPDGDRPNLLVGGFPDAGPGSHDLYQIYGNLLVHNPREALFQGSGRISFHDNILVDGQYAAAVVRDHDLPLRLAHIYNNTIYSKAIGIKVGSPAREGLAIRGNLVFAATPISGADTVQRDNIVAWPSAARRYVKRPASRLGRMDFYPRPGRASGTPLDLSPFATELDFDRDFNGLGKGAHTFRGAYAGAGSNPGWRLQAQVKPEK